MEKYGKETIVLTNTELETIKKYNTIKSLTNKEKQENWLITILGLMTALIALCGIGCISLLGSIYELLEKIGGFA